MKLIDREILNINENICQNIELATSYKRGFVSQNILSQLRNLIEHIAIKCYSEGHDIENKYENIGKALAFVKSRAHLRFINNFHKLLQIVASHYTLDQDKSERLMLKYYEYLLRIRSFLLENYGLQVLYNLEQFPLFTDSELKEYYEKIAAKMEALHTSNLQTSHTDRYYIHMIKPFFINQKVYYEVTFLRATDQASKFDRVIAFTKNDISQNYSVKLLLNEVYIEVLGKAMPIQIITNWEVSIRPCELKNFSRVFGLNITVQTGATEYRNLMNYLTKTGMTLVELVEAPEEYYISIKNQVTDNGKTAKIFGVLDRCRDLITKNQPGSNVVRYLLYRLNNKVIKRQLSLDQCNKLSYLYLEYGCIPFDEMPFCSSLINHNPRLVDVFSCMDHIGREHELLARYIKNNTEIEGQLYTPKSEITEFTELENLVEKYNGALYYKHGNRKLNLYRDYIYIQGYEEATLQIIRILMELAGNGIKGYFQAVDSWLQSNPDHAVDCPDKREALKDMFEHSRVAFIYGSAGTGKTTLINHISNFFNGSSKLFLAHTNPAVDNLKRKVTASNSTYSTITRFLARGDIQVEYDLLIIDECSTVSNSDMLKILEKAKYQLLILVGDTYQIESITFGNWFSIAQEFAPEKAVYELRIPYRTSNNKLITLWDKIRNLEEDSQEHLVKNGYSRRLDYSIFKYNNDDAIILCLNYNGFYGINNINTLLQANNPHEPVQWGIQTYKVDDPILFNEMERFAPLIYNNLKGKIVGIEKSEDQIQFDVEVEKAIHQLEVLGYDLELLGHTDDNNSIIRFLVDKEEDTDEDINMFSSIVPFQVAYAVSFHKAQGLEYDYVKIVITNELEERVTHDVFYTAVTRARKFLNIYWSPETERNVLSNLRKKNIQRDKALLRTKLHNLVESP